MKNIAIISIFIFIVIIVLFKKYYNKKDRNEFNLLLKKIFFIIGPLCVFCFTYYFISEDILKKTYGISMQDQITITFDQVNNYENFILGNSRIYRGINPEYLKTNTYYNFAFDNDTYIESYYKIKYLLDNDIKVNSIILGVDIFEFSFIPYKLKNYYSKYFSSEYLLNFKNENINEKFLDQIDNSVNSIVQTKFSINGSRVVDYILHKQKYSKTSYKRNNGQYVILPEPKAKKGDFVIRDSNMLNIQKDNFEKIIQLVNNRNIKLLMIIPPTRSIEKRNYTESKILDMLDYFKSFETTNIKFIDTSDSLTNYKLFMDETHLNHIGSENYSIMLNNILRSLLL